MVVSATGTPVLEHSVGLEEVSDWTNALGDWSQEPFDQPSQSIMLISNIVGR